MRRIRDMVFFFFFLVLVGVLVFSFVVFFCCVGVSCVLQDARAFICKTAQKGWRKSGTFGVFPLTCCDGHMTKKMDQKNHTTPRFPIPTDPRVRSFYGDIYGGSILENIRWYQGLPSTRHPTLKRNDHQTNSTKGGQLNFIRV